MLQELKLFIGKSFFHLLTVFGGMEMYLGSWSHHVTNATVV